MTAPKRTVRVERWRREPRHWTRGERVVNRVFLAAAVAGATWLGWLCGKDLAGWLR